MEHIKNLYIGIWIKFSPKTSAILRIKRFVLNVLMQIARQREGSFVASCDNFVGVS